MKKLKEIAPKPKPTPKSNAAAKRISPSAAAEMEELKNRLQEAEETLEAIRSGAIDALVVSGPRGDQVYALKGAEQPYRILVESMHEGALILSENGAILNCNQAFSKIAGTPHGAVVGRLFRELVAEKDRDKFATLWGEAIREEAKAEIELNFNGRTVPVEISINARDHEGEHWVFAVVTDLSERLQSEAELRASEDKFRYVFDHSIIGKSITLPSGEVNVNKAFSEMLGYTREEFRGYRWQDITHPEDLEHTQLALNQLLAGEQTSARFAKRYIHKDGSVVWADINTSLRRDQNGQPLYFMTSVIDITERIKAEEEIRTLNAELEQRVAERTAQLEAANKELEAFSYSVSHDLRAPLRAVDGFTSILLGDHASSLDDEGKRICGLISRSARIMGKLIDDLLAFSRVGRTIMEPSAVDMATMAQSIFYEITTPEGRERIDFQVAPLPPAHGDPSLFRQVWINLLANAVKFSAKKARAVIEVGADQQGDEIVYSVRDNGAGFDMRYYDKLFGVFQRLHGTKEFEGTGVGLAIVQRIIMRHGGRIWGEGETDKGATFYFTLGKREEAWTNQQ